MNKVLTTAKKFVSEVKQSGTPVSSAYLFGSYAKGMAHKDSDIDICIISPIFGKDYFDEAVKLRFLSHKVDSRIEPVPFNPTDMQDKYSTLATEIKKHGILLTK